MSTRARDNKLMVLDIILSLVRDYPDNTRYRIMRRANKLREIDLCIDTCYKIFNSLLDSGLIEIRTTARKNSIRSGLFITNSGIKRLSPQNKA